MSETGCQKARLPDPVEPLTHPLPPPRASVSPRVKLIRFGLSCPKGTVESSPSRILFYAHSVIFQYGM